MIRPAPPQTGPPPARLFAPLLNPKKRPFKPSNFIQGESPGEPPNPAPGGGPLPLRKPCSASAPPRLSQNRGGGNKPGEQAGKTSRVQMQCQLLKKTGSKKSTN